jgi:50S ribosomal subunit-associated GTPase HflX
MTCRVIVHVVNGDSEDPVGDFRAINEELRLFSPQLAGKVQAVAVNKVDIPAVRARLPGLVQELREAAGHGRVVGISAATTEGVQDLMRRVQRLVGRAALASGTGTVGTGDTGTGISTYSSSSEVSRQHEGKENQPKVDKREREGEAVVSFDVDDMEDGGFEVVALHPHQPPSTSSSSSSAAASASGVRSFLVVGRRIEKVTRSCLFFFF